MKNISNSSLSVCKYIFIGIYISFVLSCNKQDILLNKALSAAGENKKELKKVLDYYRYEDKDSLKLKAAEFLISNMLYNYSYQGEDIHFINTTLDSLFSLSPPASVKELKEEFKQITHKASFQDVSINADIHSITADYLIKNIDEAFLTREYPWCKELEFQEFYEIILPYRTGQEIMEEWRELYKERFTTDIDSLLNNKTDIAAICEYLAHCYYNTSTKERPLKQHLPPSVLIKIPTGDCIDYSRLGIYIGRTFGIPVVCDFVPNWGKTAGWHQWCVLLKKDGSQYPFSIASYEPFGQHVANSVNSMAKVFRRTASINYTSLAMQNIAEIPLLFRDPYIKDVSHLYFEAVDIDIELDFENKYKSKVAYLTVFDGTNWKPVDWGFINQGYGRFKNISPSCLYMVMYYKNNSFLPASYPFHLDEQKNSIKLIPDTTAWQTIHFKRKNNSEVNRYAKHLTGGKFQVANSPDFKDAIDLYTIDTLYSKSKQVIEPEKTPGYKYFRYLAPYNSTGYMAEIELYNESEEKLTGEIIGTEGSYAELGNDKYKMFDNDIYTFFDAPVNENVWGGMVFNKPETIKKIIFYPRYDNSEIKESDLYELLYWDTNTWKSLGEKYGNKENQTISFSCPTNRLYLLKNKSTGDQERITTYKDNTQYWW